MPGTACPVLEGRELESSRGGGLAGCGWRQTTAGSVSAPVHLPVVYTCTYIHTLKLLLIVATNFSNLAH